MFERIVHADWSKHPPGRVFASARRTPAGWEADGPWPVGDVGAFVDGLVSRGRRGPTLAAFDFPIGLPVGLVAKPEFEGLSDFRGALDAFGSGGWADWFEPAATAGEISVRRPFFPARPGGATMDLLRAGLGLADKASLLRACERGSPGVPAAGCMFWLVGAKTVGKAAIHGWQTAIRPALARGARLWPFDGDLEDLATASGLVLAESYPADALVQLGFVVDGRKSDPKTLATLAPAIRACVSIRRISLSLRLNQEVVDGFARWGRSCGDAFDAVIGLLAAVAVAEGARAGAPKTEDVRQWEGWILGRSPSAGIPAPAGAFKAGGET